MTGIELKQLKETLKQVELYSQEGGDPLGREFTQPALQAPYRAVCVTAGLFHTQGGLDINKKAQVLQENGEPFHNLFAVGGAARGLSGREASGYLSGNGLLSAVVLGRIAGLSVKNVYLKN